jgi:hypothetical protein
MPYETYIDHRVLGPRPKYRIVRTDSGSGQTALCIVGPDNTPVGPERAKIIISSATGLARMLFKDPDSQEWVEPESFYSFSSDTFYEEEKHPFTDSEGVTIEAFNAPVWQVLSQSEVQQWEGIISSLDTVNDMILYHEKRSRAYPPC